MWVGAVNNPRPIAACAGLPRSVLRWGDNAGVMTEPTILTNALRLHIDKAIAQAGGWVGFDQFMAMALYTPGLGYYANDTAKFGAMPDSGSDFVTAPELSPAFGQLLAAQVAEA